MRIHFIIACFGTAIMAKNSCVMEEKTWSVKGQLEFLPNFSLKECISAFVQNTDGQALTYFGSQSLNRFENVCIIFGSLDGERSCTDCISIKGNVVTVSEFKRVACKIEKIFVSIESDHSQLGNWEKNNLKSS